MPAFIIELPKLTLAIKPNLWNALMMAINGMVRDDNSRLMPVINKEFFTIGG
jgi:hypothetical protein